MKSIITTSILALLFFSMKVSAQPWQVLATDQINDGSNSLLADGSLLEYYQDTLSDSIHFKVYIENLNNGVSSALGCNIMFDIPGGGNTFNFWGQNNTEAFHTLLTVWVTGSAPSSYSGTMGFANSFGIQAGNYTNLSENNISIHVDQSQGWVELGIKRTDLVADEHFVDDELSIGVAAAVGSNEAWNDDIVSDMTDMVLLLPSSSEDPEEDDKNTWPVGLEQLSTQKVLIYPNPTSSGILNLTINESITEKMEFTIYNNLGVPVLRNEVNQNSHVIDVGFIPSGVYHYVLSSSEKPELIKGMVILKK